MYIFTAEIYPTVVRSMSIGLLNGGGRIAGLLPPLLLPFVDNGEYLLALGLMALTAGGLIWLLPETKDVEMMNTLKDGEKFNAEFGGLKWSKRMWLIHTKEEANGDT